MLALWLLLVDPADLLRDLSSDDIEIRQVAAAELFRRGDALRKDLLDARRDASDVESRSRLDDILRRLDLEERIRGFGGDNRVSNFGLSLRSDRFHGRGVFRLTIEVMNLGPAAQAFPGLGLWDVERPDQETKIQGAEARLTVKKLIGGGLRRTRWGPPSGEAGTPVRLRPGESTKYEYVLDAKALPAGDYDVRVEYFAAERLPGAEENLRSNSLRLMIR